MNKDQRDSGFSNRESFPRYKQGLANANRFRPDLQTSEHRSIGITTGGAGSSLDGFVDFGCLL